ncbi:hypothetical protein BaRGS_00017313 [Batillaria attramentaria]|uniref:Uncharacterized protein n=1 Tax=Batillaria attramentaria TaxID=370345 RepID=A0ABD0KX56_9CAEN
MMERNAFLQSAGFYPYPPPCYMAGTWYNHGYPYHPITPPPADLTPGMYPDMEAQPYPCGYEYYPEPKGWYSQRRLSRLLGRFQKA